MKKYLIHGNEVVEKVKEAYSKLKNFTVFDAEKVYEMEEFINPCIAIDGGFEVNSETGEVICAYPIEYYLGKAPEEENKLAASDTTATVGEVAKYFRDHSGSFIGYCVTVSEEKFSFVLAPHDKEHISVMVFAPRKEFKDNFSYESFCFHHCLFPKKFEQYGDIYMFDKFFIPDEEAFDKYEYEIKRIGENYFDHHTKEQKIIYSEKYHKEIDNIFRTVPLVKE